MEMEKILQQLEQRIEQLIHKCHALQRDQAVLKRDKKRLENQHLQTIDKLEKVISRIKTLEETA